MTALAAKNRLSPLPVGTVEHPPLSDEQPRTGAAPESPPVSGTPSEVSVSLSASASESVSASASASDATQAGGRAEVGVCRLGTTGTSGGPRQGWRRSDARPASRSDGSPGWRRGIGPGQGARPNASSGERTAETASSASLAQLTAGSTGSAVHSRGTVADVTHPFRSRS